MASLLCIGQMVHLKPLHYTSGVRTKVADVDNDTVYVMTPTELVDIRPGVAVSLWASVPGGELRFQGFITKVSDGAIPLLAIRLSSDADRVQQRRFFRLPIGTRVAARKLTSPAHSALISYSGLTEDLSGSGVRFVCDEQFPVAARLDLDLILRERPLIGLTGIVVRSWEERPRVYGHAVEFVDLSMREQDDIVRFVFSEQVRRRTNDLF